MKTCIICSLNSELQVHIYETNENNFEQAFKDLGYIVHWCGEIDTLITHI